MQERISVSPRNTGPSSLSLSSRLICAFFFQVGFRMLPHEKINWKNVFLLYAIPLSSLCVTSWVPLCPRTLSFSIFYYVQAALGITAGYHRLWSHRSYRATFLLRFYLAVAGSAAAQGSIKWWCRHHRNHHRYTDTDRDPYSISRGLFYSHCGWLLVQESSKESPKVDITDLEEDSIVQWQYEHYAGCLLVTGLLLPTITCGFLWNDWGGGFLYAGVLRIFFLQQATFCVNSLAHWLGSQPYDDNHSPHDHMITALLTLGEGYHNFHHEFSSDYRNALRWYQYDPTKWAIAVWEMLGLSSHLKRFPQNEIDMGRVQQLQKHVDKEKSLVNWGIPPKELPVFPEDDYHIMVRDGKALTVISGIIYNIEGFRDTHPGGKVFMDYAIGKDVTASFSGGVYGHSNAAYNLLAGMRFGRLYDDGDE